MTPEEAFIQATKLRAKAYYYIYDELLNAFGKDQACTVLSKAVYRLGLDKSATFPADVETSAKLMAETFAKDPIGSRVFAQRVAASDKDSARVEMKSCPLVEMWQEMGLEGDTIKTLCDIACRIDYGTMEGRGYHLDFPARIACRDSSCILDISR